MPNDIHDRLDRARALARENIDKAGERAKSAGSKASEKLADARSKADEAIVGANRIVAEHPLAAVAAAVTVGAVAAYLFPKTARRVRAAAPVAGGMARHVPPSLLAMVPKLASVALAARKQAKSAAQTGIEKASAGIEVASETLSDVSHQVEAAIDKSGIRKKASTAASKIASRVRKIKDQ